LAAAIPSIIFARAIVTPAVPAFTAAMAVSTFIHASTVPAVNVEAERNLFDHVELVGHTGGQRKRHRLGARGSQRTSHDNRQAGRDQEFAHEISLWLGVSLLLILAQRASALPKQRRGLPLRSDQSNGASKRSITSILR